ncbi:MAG: tRNA dihydrouridine synthase [Desulfovibrionales bacterium]
MHSLITPESPWLAPLAGFSDLPFRMLCRSLGCEAACTEMVSAKGLVFESPGTRDLLRTCPEDSPLVVQLFGSEPDYLSRAVRLLQEKGFDLFDLNAGCSVRKVTRTGGGAALLRDPDLLVRCAREMVSLCGPGKVGVKIRRGWSPNSDVSVQIGKRLEDAGIGWITLHPRWAVQSFSGHADWECLARLQDALSIPVMGSGDLFSAEDGIQCLGQTGIQGIMFARGALRDPRIFQRFASIFRTGESKSPPLSIPELVHKHKDLCFEYGSQRKALLKMKTIVPRYLRRIPGAKSLRREFTLCTSWEEFDSLLLRLGQMTHLPGEEENNTNPAHEN